MEHAGHARALLFLSATADYLGDVAGADKTARHGLAAAVELEDPGLLSAGGAARGRVDEARASRSKSWIAAGSSTGTGCRLLGRWVLGFVALSADAPAEALDALEGLPETMERQGIGDPGRTPVLPDVVEALVAVGRLEEAETVLAGLEAQGSALTGGGRCSWQVRRCCGWESAVVLLRCSRGAKAVFAELGAELWLARAVSELRRANPRRRRDRGLTSAERRVAALVAAGRTNREVAVQHRRGSRSRPTPDRNPRVDSP